MIQPHFKTNSLFLVLFLLFSFGTGIIFVTASTQNTEGRSKAAAYNSPTPIDEWGQCMSWDAENNCLDTYRSYKKKRDADWRCKDLFIGYGLCEPSVELPTVPGP